ncbi:MAG: F0F1 ATP synthase subunit A [Planctomycetota bacterium]
MSFTLLSSHDPLDHVLPHRFGKPLVHWDIEWTSPLDIVAIHPHDTYFTNQLLMTLVAAGLLLLVMTLVGRRYTAMAGGGVERCVPTGFAGAIEGIMAFLRNSVAQPVLGDKADRFMPFLWTAFFYILTCNLLGMVPLDGIIHLVSGGSLQHIGGTATGNIMITAGLAACAFLMIHVSGTQEIYTALVNGTYGHHHHEEASGGLSHHEAHGHHVGMSPVSAVMAAPILYLWNFAPHVFKPDRIEGVGSVVLLIADFVMWVGLLILEMIGAVIKPFALAIRLFANMVAGHVVLASILALIFVFKGSVTANYGLGIVSAVGAAALSLLELFVAFLQAYVFVFLTTLFIGASVSPEH